MASKVAMQFSQNFHICNQNIVFNIPMKNQLSMLKGSCIGNFASFSQFFPTQSRLVYDSTMIMILAILYSEVPHILPAKYQPNPPGGSGEEVI